MCADVLMADVCSAGGADNSASGGDNWTGSPDALAEAISGARGMHADLRGVPRHSWQV